MNKYLKYLIISIIVLIILFFLTYKEEKRFDKFAVIEIINNPYGFGEISLKDTINHRFLLINKSDNLFVIKKILPSCTCTGVKYDKTTAMKNDTVKVDVEYIPKPDQIGNVETIVFLECNADKGVLKLLLKGTVIE